MLVEILSCILIALFIGISTSAGIGGGTIINVFLIYFFGYSAKKSIVVTYIFLMGGGLATTIASAKKFTAQGKRYIDYDLVLITLPMTMSGAMFGVMINHLISQLIVVIIFIMLILNLMNTSYKKLKEVQVENQKKIIQPTIPLLQVNRDEQNFRQRLSQIIATQNQLFPIQKLKIIGQIYVYTVVLVLFKGGKKFDSIIGLQSCGIGSMVCAILHLMLSFLYCKSIAMQKFQKDNQKQSLGYVFQSNQKMTYQKMREGMFNGFIAGTLGATVAIGGGLVLVPIWLKMGMDKNIVTSSTGPLIFFSSSVSFLISALLEQYDNIFLVLFFFGLSFTGAYVVKQLMVYLTQTYKVKKLVYVLLLFTMVASLIAFLPLQYMKYENDPEQFLQFEEFC